MKDVLANATVAAVSITTNCCPPKLGSETIVPEYVPLRDLIVSPGSDLIVAKSSPNEISVEPIPIAAVKRVLSTCTELPLLLKILILFGWLTSFAALKKAL